MDMGRDVERKEMDNKKNKRGIRGRRDIYDRDKESNRGIRSNNRDRKYDKHNTNNMDKYNNIYNKRVKKKGDREMDKDRKYKYRDNNNRNRNNRRRNRANDNKDRIWRGDGNNGAIYTANNKDNDRNNNRITYNVVYESRTKNMVYSGNGGRGMEYRNNRDMDMETKKMKEKKRKGEKRKRRKKGKEGEEERTMSGCMRRLCIERRAEN